MLRKVFSFLTLKILIIAILMLFQLMFLLTMIFLLSEYFVAVHFLLLLLSFIISVYIYNRNDNPSYKMTWIILILTVPILGGFLYLLFGGQKIPIKLRMNDGKSANPYINQDESILMELKEKDGDAYKQANYLWKRAGFPLYRNQGTSFYPLGEEKFQALCNDLRKAKHYIFLEYFIITPGLMWDSILSILKEKANEGVDVRILYDDAGCLGSFPIGYHKTLAKDGIRVKAFNKIEPKLVMQMNNRDHRKIAVVDGLIGYTGGINLADEYINEIERFGHWKDNAVRLQGECVWSMTLMFLQFWNYNEKNVEDMMQFKPNYAFAVDGGYVQPFCDAPTDAENVGESTHMNLIHSAKSYVYAMTPYLIIDQEMKVALTLAAKNGVDVRIIVPHVPDKKSVFLVTQANYLPLLEAGVKIYEYTPGFVHGKMMISDDKMAVLGTINMDYRSYYLHYECGVCFYGTSTIMDMKKDYEDTLLKSEEITLKQMKSLPVWKRMLMGLLSLFSPLI